MYKENNKGPRTVPWGTPDKTGAQSDFTPFTTTRCCLKQRAVLVTAAAGDNGLWVVWCSSDEVRLRQREGNPH